MRMIVLVLALLSAGLPARAQDDAIRDVIERQMEAFRAGDPAAAFAFASPMIKRIFGTPETFGAMVQSGYPMIWEPGEVRFLGASRGPEGIEQRLAVTDRQGGIHFFDYDMIETPDGWQINGVRPVRGDLGA